MRRFLISTAVAMLAVGAWSMSPAAAHNFNGGGDCTGWTLNLDGDWGASRILVDGVDKGLAQTISIPDDSDATSRSFTVTWDKATDVVVTHELSRSVEGCQPPHDECPNIPGDQPEGTDCYPDICPDLPGDQVEGDDCTPEVPEEPEVPEVPETPEVPEEPETGLIPPLVIKRPVPATPVPAAPTFNG